ncbi:hypothetical protein ABZ250_34885 [Streptomyces afghaniensis]|uniref:hypothetical protein n=1 Tax=Streptomyces afghaniensis TaxID=66865 RepID=UPI0033A15FA6
MTLTPAWLRADRTSLRLDFAQVPRAYRDTAKLLFYALLTEDTPPGEEPITISSVRTYFTCVRHFLLWAQGSGRALAQLTGDDLDGYHGELTSQRLSVSGVYRHRRAVRMLWAYRSRMTDHLGQDPLRRPLWQAWARAHPRRYDENLTDRIPAHVMGPLLSWALRWVDDLADDVLAARAERDDIDARPPAHPDPVMALQSVLDGFRQRGQPLPTASAHVAPGRHGDEAVPNFSYLARLAGHPRCRFDKVRPRRLIEEAASDLGVDTDSPLRYRVQAQIDGQPWLEHISYYDVGQFERLLQVSCWIVIAYLSGMRDSEIKHLQRGCVSTQRDAGGRIYRHRLNGLAFKGESVHGTAATWIVTAPVARAVAVLEHLQPADEPYLFAHPRKSANHHRRQHVAERVRTSATTIKDNGTPRTSGCGRPRPRRVAWSPRARQRPHTWTHRSADPLGLRGSHCILRQHVHGISGPDHDPRGLALMTASVSTMSLIGDLVFPKPVPWTRVEPRPSVTPRT